MRRVFVSLLLTALTALGGLSARGQLFFPPLPPPATAITYTTFDPLAIGTGQSLSGGNLVDSWSSAQRTVQTIDAWSTGIYYFECTFSFSSNANLDYCGVESYRNDITLTAQLDFYILPSGHIFLNGTDTGTTLGGMTTGDVVRIVFDETHDSYWMSKNGGNWNANGSANPSTNTGGLSFSTVAAPLMVFASVGHSGDTVTLAPGPTFGYSVPSGVTAGLPSNHGIWAAYPAFDPNEVYGSCSAPTFSNTNHTVAAVGSPGSFSQAGVSLSPGRAAGKYMVEYTIGASWGSGSRIGTYYTGSNGCNALDVSHSLGIAPSGAVNLSGSIGTGQSWGATNVIDEALDFTDGEVWYKVLPSGNWNNNPSADPATNTGGFSLSNIICPCNPAVSMHSASDSVAINNGSTAFSGTLPSGFTGYANFPQ